MGIFNNYYSNTLISGTSSSDVIYNSTNTQNVTINGGAGSDSISSHGTNLSIEGGAGDDTLDISARSGNLTNSTISGGDGDDRIYNNIIFNTYSGSQSTYHAATNILYSGGIGSDYMQINFSDYSTIFGGEGEDRIHNGSAYDKYTGYVGNHNLVDGEGGADTFYNYGNFATLKGSGGNDYIYNSTGTNAFIDGGSDNDYISNGTTWTTHYADGSRETYYSGGNDSTILGGAGNDSIYNQGSNVSIDGGTGNDYIYIYKQIDPSRTGNVTITGGAGADTIHNKATNAVISGGVENDVISLTGSAQLINYAVGDGFDTIYGYTSSDTIKITGAEYETSVVGSDVLIKVGTGSITLKNVTVSSLKIDGTPKDAPRNISNNTPNQLITTGSFNDTITNNSTGSRSTISSDGSNDRIYNYADSVSIDSGIGNDRIYNYGNFTTIDSGADNDYIYNYATGHAHNIINAGSGSDYIDNFSSYATLNGDDDDDTVWNYGEYTVADGGRGNDFLHAVNDNTTLLGGEGNDTLCEHKNSNNLLDAGEGNNFIRSLYSTSGTNNTVKAGAGNDTITFRSSYSTIDAGDGNNKVNLSSAESDLVNTGSGNDTINLSISKSTINAGAGVDSVWNYGQNNIINLGDGNDFAANDSSNVTINAGEGNDLIRNHGSYSTVNGEGGNDTLYNDGSNIAVDGGAGEDVIVSGYYGTAVNVATLVSDTSNEATEAANATIKGGAGNDTIALGAKTTKQVIQYAAGDGNDVIYGFGNSEDNVFQITSGSITSTLLSGDDLVLTIGSGTVTFKDVKGLDLQVRNPDGTLSKVKAYEENPEWTISGTTAYYGTSTNHIITISGISESANTSNFSLEGNVVTVSANALGTNTVTISSDYELKLADDVAQPVNTAAGWTIANGTAVYNAAAVSEGYSCTGTSIAYTPASGGEVVVTVSGLRNEATESAVSIDGTVVTVGNGALDTDKVVTISDGYTLALGSDVTKSTDVEASWAVSEGNAAYTPASKTLGYLIIDNTIVYNDEANPDIAITITGLKNSATAADISLNGTVVTISAAALDSGNTVTINSGYTLALASDVTEPEEVAPSWTISEGTATYRAAGMTAGYISDGSTINYSQEVIGDELIKIAGLTNAASDSDITLSGTKVTINSTVINAAGATVEGAGYSFEVSGAGGKLLAGSDDITLLGGDSSDTLDSNGMYATLDGAGGNDVFYLSYLRPALVKFSGNSGEDTIFGYNSNHTLAVPSNYTISTAEDDVIITFSEGNSVRLVDAVYEPATFFDGTKIVDVTLPAPMADGVYLDYTEDEDPVHITNSTDYNTFIDFNDEGGNSIEITEDATGEKEVNAGDGGDELTNYAAFAHVTLNGGEGDDTIVNGGNYATINASGGNDVISIVGGAALIKYAEGDGRDSIYGVDENTTLHITEGDYSTVIDDNDVLIVVADNSTIKVVDGVGKTFWVENARGQVETVKAVEVDTVEFNNANTAATLLSGFEGTFDLADYSTVKTVQGSAATKDIEILGNAKANYLIGGKGHDKIDGNAGNDVITGNVGDDTLNGGKGDDTLTGGSGADVFIYNAGEGKDVIKDYTSGTDTLNISNGAVKQASLSGDDVILTIGTGTITLKDAKDTTITITDENGTSYDTVLTDELTVDDSQPSTIKMTDEYKQLDASHRTKPIKITGNSKANTIQGGAKADTISGGAGNDSLLGLAGNDVLKGDKGNDTLNGGKGNDTLTGGEGKDVFIISGGQGNDVITDYVSGEDKIKIGGGTLKSITTVSGTSKDVVFNFTSGKATVKNAKAKTISYINASGKSLTTIVGGTDTVDTVVTLGSSDSSVYTAKKDIVTISASKRTNAIKITGNSKDNVIKGGKGKDSIYGGTGADSILGNAGNDKLYGQAGNDTLLGGAGADTLEGGAGNDILTGGAGNDVFTYTTGDGNDTITDYAANDQIRIKGTYTTTNKSGNAVIKVGSGSITVLNTTAKNLTISTQTAKYEERWFMDNSEFGIRNSELETIINNEGSAVISNDYNYDINTTISNQLKPENKLTTNKK